jgi:hypothetical protein
MAGYVPAGRVGWNTWSDLDEVCLGNYVFVKLYVYRRSFCRTTCFSHFGWHASGVGRFVVFLTAPIIFSDIVFYQL